MRVTRVFRRLVPPVLTCALLFVSSPGAATQSTQGPVSPCPGCGFPPEPRDDADRAGWRQIFDGRTLSGWDGNPGVWSVADGAITAESTAARRVGSTFLIWRGGEPGDFELSLEMKADADIHSGVFYRGKVGPAPPRAPGAGRSGAAPTTPRPQPPPIAVPADPRWNVIGYCLDFDYALDNDGNLQDTARSETQIGWRGHVVRMEPGKRPRSIGSIGDRDAMKSAFKPGDWNRLHVIARGNTLTHIVNGQLMTVVMDDDPSLSKAAGVIALQIEQFGTGRVSFRNIWLKP
jgi:3-keto-disaccharide hydrolase